MFLNLEPQRRTCAEEPIRAAAHPLLQHAASTSSEKRYSTRLDGSEFFLRDHRLNGAHVLPGVCYLEMARAAVAASFDGESNAPAELELRQVIFLRTLVVDTPLDVHVRLRAEDDGRIGFEIYSHDSSAGPPADEILHAKGRASVRPRADDVESRIDVDRLLASCAQSIDVDRCYAAFDSMGMSYGPTFRALGRLHAGYHPDGRRFVLARVTVPDDAAWPRQALHPSILDAALQACVGLGSLDAPGGTARAGEAKGAALPFALDRARIVAPCARSAWVLAQPALAGSSVPPSSAAGLQKFDIDVLDDTGCACVALRGFAAVDRAEAVPATRPAAPESAQIASSAERLRAATEAALIAHVAQQLSVACGDVTREAELSELGFDSIALTSLAETLSRAYAVDLSPTLFFEYSTIRSIVDYLMANHGPALAERLGVRGGALSAEVEPLPLDAAAVLPGPKAAGEPRSHDVAPARSAERSPIAVIGMSGRFPGGTDLQAFWDNLLIGRDCISSPPSARRDDLRDGLVGTDSCAAARPGGYIEGIDELDAAFFGIPAEEARLMDPNQRLLLTYAWKAIEDAGYAPRSLWGSRTGVFVAIAGSGYGELVARAGVGADAFGAVGAVPSMGPNRLSHWLNLRGPSEPVETACSSSLVAIHRAMRALRGGECDLALVGGVNTIISCRAHDMFSGAGMLSADGRCRPFSKHANGYVRGEGVGMLLLKSASAAERDGDHVYGLLRAAAASHGGRASSLIAPNPRAQAEIVKAALAEADVDPATVTYIEAHGTGTALGDAIEVSGLKKAFAELRTAPTARCGLGSVKSNTGHLELAAGIASVIKVLLQMQHRKLPSTLHCEDLNPHIDFGAGPFYVVRESQTWEPPTDADGRPVPRRAGVSAFGFGGVNAHVLIEEYVAPRSSGASVPAPAVVVLSAKTRPQLRQQAAQLSRAIEGGHVTDSNLASAAYTLQLGRDAMPERFAVAVDSAAQLAETLEAFAASREPPSGVLVHGADVRARHAKAPHGERRCDALMAAWVRGADVDWTQLYPSSSHPRRMSLPTYPFLRERHWVLDSSSDRPRSTAVSAAARAVEGSGVAGAEQFLVLTIAEIRRCAVADIDTSLGFLELGLSSYELLEIAARIERVVGQKVSPVLLFEHASFRELARHLESTYAQAAQRWSSSSASEIDEPDADEEPAVFRDFRMGKVTLEALLGLLRNEGERLSG